MHVKRIGACTHISSTVYELQRDIGRKLQLFPTSLAFNAPVRSGPWDNRGNVTWMERGFNACQTPRSMYPSIFNRFPVIQAVSLKVRHFSTFFASPVYAPGTIAIHFTRLERGFNACKMPCCIYPSISQPFLRYSKLLVENYDIFVPQLCLAAPQGVTPLEFREDLDIHKTRMHGLSCGEESMTIYSAVLIGCQRVTDRQTDGRTSRLYLLRASAQLTHVKTNDLKVFKLDTRNDLGISQK